MYINVTQKAKTFFKHFQQVTDAEQAKKEALADPLFSWHATAVSMDQYAVIIFMNDASHLLAMVPMKSVDDYRYLQEQFVKQLFQQFENDGMSKADIKQYLAQAGNWQINHTIDRTIVGSLSQVARRVNNILTILPAPPSADQLVQQADTLTDILTAPQSNWSQDQMTLHHDLSQLQYIEEHREELIAKDKVDENVTKICQFNQEIIMAFITSIVGTLSDKTVNRHLDRLKFYLNEYLASHLSTLLGPEVCDLAEPLYHGFSMNEMKETRAALKKFYKYLHDQDLISDDYWSTVSGQLRSALAGVDEDGLPSDDVGNDDWGLDSFDDDVPELPIFDDRTERQLTKYCNAMANLYGIISCDQAYRIIKRLNPHLARDTDKLTDWFEAHRINQGCEFMIHDINWPMIINADIDDLDQAKRLLQEQLGKPFFIPNKRELLKYRNPDYFEANQYTRAYSKALQKYYGVPANKCQDYTILTVDLLKTDSSTRSAQLIHDVQDAMQQGGFALKDEDALTGWVQDLMELSNHIRIWNNRGWSPAVFHDHEIDVLAIVKQAGKITDQVKELMADAEVDPFDMMMITHDFWKNGQENKIMKQLDDMNIDWLSD